MERCHLCQGVRLRPLYGRLVSLIGRPFFRCEECRLIQADPGVSTAEEEDFYASRYYALSAKEREYESRLAIFDDLLERLGRITAGRALLDIGCGPGDFVAAAVRCGWRAAGVDVSPAAVEAGRKRHGVELYVGRAGEPVGDGRRYDVVTFWNVLDQLTEPLAALAAARDLLQPGGWVALRVPNGAFHHAFRSLCAPFPGLVRRLRLYDFFSVHLFSFTPRTLGRTLRASGFERIAVANAPVSRGDPSARVRGLSLCALRAAKRAAFLGAEAIRLVSLGRCHVAPSLLALAQIAPAAHHSPIGKDR